MTVTYFCGMDSAALAAKCRVHRWEDQDNGGLRVARRLRYLRSCIAASDSIVCKAVWREWLAGNFFACVQEAQVALQSRAEERAIAIPLLLQGESSVPTSKQDWQRRCREALRQVDPAVVPRHLRRKMDNFALNVLPGHRVRRAMLMLQGIASLVPPRVWLATLKAKWNGWTIHFRFQ